MQFRVPGYDETFTLVRRKYTFAEAKAVEKYGGVTIEALMENKPETHTMVVLQAVYWVSMKRLVPTLVYADLEELSLDDFEMIGETRAERKALGQETPEDLAAEAEGDGGEDVAPGPTSPAPVNTGAAPRKRTASKRSGAGTSARSRSSSASGRGSGTASTT